MRGLSNLQQSCVAQDRGAYGIIIDHQALGMDRQYTIYLSDPTTTWPLIATVSTLHSSFHQTSFNSTAPLAPDALGSLDVFFLARNGYPLYSQPLFRNTHQPSTNPVLSPSESDHGLAFVLEQKPKVLALGFLLIELMLGQTLDALRGDTGPGNLSRR